MFEIKILDNEKKAQDLIDFCFSDKAFSHQWAPGEKDMLKESVLDGVAHKGNCHYWYMENGGIVIGVIGIRENKYKSAGWEMSEDYFAVHGDFRGNGLGSELLKTAENFVKSKNGRYIVIVSCDTDYYKPARLFYEKHGYKKVSEIPDYFVIGEGRMDFYKKLD